MSVISAMLALLERFQLVGQLVGADVELLVEVVDLALAVDALAGPLAVRAAAPDAPVGTIVGLLLSSRLNQAGAAVRTDVHGRRPCFVWLVVTGLSHLCLIEPGKGIS